MCTSPRKIINRTKSYSDGNTKYSLMVPCGECEDCRASRADEWWQRIHQEFLDCQAAGGKVLFANFTYNDIHLPYFHYKDYAGNDRSFSCFRKSDKDRFVKSLRDYFRRFWKIPEKECTYPFKYIFASEYGTSETGTHRPHYHALLFLPSEWVNKFGVIESDWKALIRRFWVDSSKSPLGFVRWNPEHSIFVNSDFACLYTSKYICKDVGFYGNQDVDDFCYDMKRSIYDKKYQQVKDYLPHHWQSLFFGSSLENIYGDINNYIAGYNFNLASEREKGTVVTHKCPMYIEKRMLYYKDANGDAKLNDIGRKFKKDKFLYTISKNVERLSRYSDPIFLSKRVTDNDVAEFPLVPCKTVLELAQWIKYNADSLHKITEYVLYNRVWLGLITRNFSDIEYLSSLDYNEFLKTSIDQEVNRIYDTSCDLYNSEGVFHNLDDFGVFFFYFIPRFRDFPLLKRVYEWVDTTFRQRSLEKYLEQRRFKQRTKKELFKIIDAA